MHSTFLNAFRKCRRSLSNLHKITMIWDFCPERHRVIRLITDSFCVNGIYLSLLQKSFNVIPAHAGIQVFQGFLAPGFRGGYYFIEFCKRLIYLLLPCLRPRLKIGSP